MIKLPEPALINEIRYSGIAVNEMVSENLYTEAQLKQALRDFGEQVLNCYSPDDSAQDWADKIRALIKEI